MKKYRLGLWGAVLVGLGLAAWASSNADFRTFTDVKGRKVRARIVEYDPRTNKLRLERENHRRVRVPLSLFSEEDREYVLKEWFPAYCFQRKMFVRISAKRRAGNPSASYSGPWAVKKTPYFYVIEVENRSRIPYEDLSLEYCIYYMQEVSDSGGFEKREGVLHEEMSIGKLAPHKKWTRATSSVSIKRSELDADYVYADGRPNKTTGKVYGIWIRLYLTLPSGRTVTREYLLPDSLRNSHHWATDSIIP